ncbi:glycine-rich domain-containing protein [Psychroserpens sp.]
MNVTDTLLPNLDLDKIVKKTADKNDWSNEKALETEMQYRAFLKAIQQEDGVSFAPTPEIDKIWHNHILDTKKYAEDCEMLFDAPLHHVPSYSEEFEETDLLVRLVKQTSDYFQENFGMTLNYGKVANNVTCCGNTKCRGSKVLAIN